MSKRIKLWKPSFRPPTKPVFTALSARKKNAITAQAEKTVLEKEVETTSNSTLSLDETPNLTPSIEDLPLSEEKEAGVISPKIVPSEEEKSVTVRRYKVLKRRQRRRQSLSVAVSEEEEELLREFAAAKEKSFSSWARETLFKAMGRKIPKRPT
jgi:hypothetical protein